MALVTVQRSPSPSTDDVDAPDSDSESPRSPPPRSRSLSESYLAVKGAALILPQSECQRRVTRGSPCGEIKYHLQSMFYLIRPQDTIKIAVKLESALSRSRYLVIVSCLGRQDTEECAILGVDINDEPTIGLVLPIWADIDVRLDGDGGFVVISQERSLVFKPVSVQAMWSALQCLHKVGDISRAHYYFSGGLTHTWLCYYQNKIHSSRDCINEWELMDDLMVYRSDKVCLDIEAASLEIQIRTKLKEIMMRVDLDEVTTRYLRTEVEKALGIDLKEYRSFIDQETMTILGQLDKPSLILEHLYLGSEWNASNLEELTQNGVGYILNVTREIDNFFPGMFEYMNIRVWDNTQGDLLKYWEKTYRFIKKAQLNGSRCLVHCKMGISRSASTVIAYLMKEFHWSSEKASEFTRNIRSCINPNEAFRAQLLTYEGILDASNQRHNQLWQPDLAEQRMECSPPDEWESCPGQGTLKEITEEILASKYGQPPPNPFTFDEVELSSRSMDSMDECFPEIPTSLSSECDNIRLIYYRRLSDHLAEPIIAATLVLDRDQASSSSDSSELAVAFYNCLRGRGSGGRYSSYSPREPREPREGAARPRFGSQSSGDTSSDEESRIRIHPVPAVQEVPVLDLGADLITETNTDDQCLGRLLRSPKPQHRLSPKPELRLSPKPELRLSPKPEPRNAKTDPRLSPKPDLSTKPEEELRHFKVEVFKPIDSPPVTRRKKAKLAGAGQSDTDESFEVVHIGDEEVVVKKGKVRRHTMDFEQLRAEPVMRESPDEETDVPPRGVVRVHMQAFESRVSPPSPRRATPPPRRATPPPEPEPELPSAGIVELHRRSYEEREGRRLVKKNSDPSERRASESDSERRAETTDMGPPRRPVDPLDVTSRPLEPPDVTRLPAEGAPRRPSDLAAGGDSGRDSSAVPVRSLVSRFEQQSPAEERAPELPHSVSAPSSPSKLARRPMERPHTLPDRPSAPCVPEPRRVRKSHGRTHPLQHLSPPEPDQLSRNPFYKTM